MVKVVLLNVIYRYDIYTFPRHMEALMFLGQRSSRFCLCLCLDFIGKWFFMQQTSAPVSQKAYNAKFT